jgi:phosphatidylserine/phosphatidylglycerophosphate/cardiolipin synthase-like enzyme
MRRKVEQLLESFQQTLENHVFSSGEKQALRQLLDEAGLTEEEKAFLRNRLFDLARMYTRQCSESRRVLNTLDWLESATKTLYRPGPKLTQEAFFSPTDDCVNVIIGYLRTARSTLRLCVFTITDDRITQQILQCHQNGIAIHVLSDNEKAFNPGSDIQILAQAGIAVRIDATSNHMHHKFALIDDEVLLTGSYNWTRSAAHFNHENILVTNDATVVNRYLECFQNLWPDMKPFPVR